MDVRIQAMNERIKEILRANVNDPFDRGSTATETLSTGNHTLTTSNKELKCVDQAVGVSTSDEYFRFKDFEVNFDDPSDSSEYPEITFDTAPSENVEVQYHFGSTFIFPTWPRSSPNKAIITINHIGTTEDPPFLGLHRTTSTDVKRYTTSWQIDVWVEDGVNVTDPDTLNTGFFSGGKLCDYLCDQVIGALQTNIDHLDEQGVRDVTLTLARDAEWQTDVKSHRKVLNFDFSHDHEL